MSLAERPIIFLLRAEIAFFKQKKNLHLVMKKDRRLIGFCAFND